MELLLILALCGGFVWLLIQVQSLQKEVARLTALSPQDSAKPVVAMPNAAKADPKAAKAVAPEQPKPATPPPTQSDIKPPVPAKTLEEQFGPLFNHVTRFWAWVVRHWVMVVAGISLALAGVFLVEYGIEQGLIGPAMRVAAAAIFGLCLLAAAEYLRRKNKGRTLSEFATMFAGAGIVALFAAGYSAYALYGLIGPGVAFVVLVIVALVGTFGGWLYGPFLTALGLVGGFAVPFLVTAADVPLALMYFYPVLITAMGLGIDSLRGWIWVTILALVGGFASLALSFTLQPDPMAMTLAMALMATIPVFLLYLSPRPAPTQAPFFIWMTRFASKETPWPDLRVVLITAAGAAGLLGILATIENAVWMPLLATTGMIVIFAVYLARTEALNEVIWATMGAFALALGMVWQPELTLNVAAGTEPTKWHMPLAYILGLTGLITCIAAWRTTSSRWPLHWSLATAVFPSLVIYALSWFWEAEAALAPGIWAMYVMAAAALLTLLVGWMERQGVARRYSAYLILGALGLIAYALFLVLSGAALTIALAAALVIAAVLDRRFDMPPVGVYVIGAVAVISSQLFVEPSHFFESNDLEFVLLLLTVLPALFAAWFVLKSHRSYPAEVLLMGLMVLGVGFVSVGIYRFMDAIGLDGDLVGFSLMFCYPMAAAFFGQVYLISKAGKLRWLRYVTAAVFGTGLLIGLAALLFVSPLVENWLEPYGPVIFNTSSIAYLGFALFLLAGARLILRKRMILRVMAWVAAGLLSLIWLVLQVRLVFHDYLQIYRSGFSQGELYTYTVLMLILGAGMLYQAMAKGSTWMRRAALALIGLTIVKVFLVDITALNGLLRALAFLVLGLSLAGLAWFDQWAAGRSVKKAD